MAKKKLILNRYRPIGKAGSGGFSTVVAAFDTTIKRNVAIKVIELDAFTAQELAWSLGLEDDEPDGGPSDETRALDPLDDLDDFDDLGADDENGFDDLPDATASRLLAPDGEDNAPNIPGLSEARVAGNLDSTHIVSVYDLVLEGTTAYLIMEYVDGTTLADFLDEHDADLTLDIIACIADGVAQALQVAHQHNILHLDIKPGNILIDKQGQVKVTDFGMAALPDAEGNHHGEGGTIGYMPPEQMRREPLDDRCDEWALASVIYEMLAGENPFEADNLADAQAAIRNAELVLPSLMWQDLDDQADDVLFYALDPDREERYLTVGDFAEEIVPLLGSPKRGKKALAELMNPQEDEPEEPVDARHFRQEPPEPRVPLAERLTPQVTNIAGRAYALVATAILLAISMVNMPAGNSTLAIIMLVVVAIGAGAATALPCIGPLVGYAALAAALTLNVDAGPAAILAVAVLAWWLFAARPRRAKAAPNLALSVPLFGAIGLGPLTPLFSGYYLTVGKAAATSALSFVGAVVLGSLGSRSLISWDPLDHALFASSSVSVTDGFLYLVQQPWVWAIGVSWVVAAIALSLCCSRGTKWLAIVGAIVAGIILVCGLVGARFLATSGAELLPNAFDLASAIISALLAVAACCVIVPGTPE